MFQVSKYAYESIKPYKLLVVRVPYPHTHTQPKYTC